MNLKPLLKLMAEKNASDLFFTPKAPIKIKIEGIMTGPQTDQLDRELEVDFAISEPGLGRFRANVFYQRGNIAMVLRYVTLNVPQLSELNLPPILESLSMAKRGLVLMVGATGSGKSTTLAAMIDHRNENTSNHIITIEEPIEFLHTNKKSIINQRELGLDTLSYNKALKSALRQDPDVILAGEIRDRETMQAAITLAGTGHLCIATLHANNAAETLDRIINLFPQSQHRQIYMDLSHYLRAIIAQRLVIGRNGKRLPAVEVLLNTPHVADLTTKGDVSGIKEALQESNEEGMQSFDASLYSLYQQGLVDLVRRHIRAAEAVKAELASRKGGGDDAQ